jgi:hypothetical protein
MFSSKTKIHKDVILSGKRRMKPLNYSKNMIKSRIKQIHG